MSADDERKNRVALVQLGTMLNDVFVGLATDALDSIQHGSPLTGAPGQPVDTSTLLNSWQLVFDTPDRAVIGTNVEYAESIEDGISYAHGGTPLTLRSSVGGWHSTALTAANLDRIVDDVTRRVAGGRNAR